MKIKRFPRETVREMAKLGLMGIAFPKEYGGAGGDEIMYTIAVEELSRVCATTELFYLLIPPLCCTYYAFR